MSHTDDPKKDPAQGGDNQVADITRADFLATVQKATGKTTDELLSMDNAALDDLIKKSFEKTDAGSSATEPPPKEPAPPVPGTKPDDQPPAAAEEEVTVAIKPSLLGSEFKGKDLRASIEEAVRTRKEAIDTVDLLKTRTIPTMQQEISQRDTRLSDLSTENETLKKSIEELRKAKPAEAPQKAVEKPVEEEIPPLPTLPPFDPFNEEVTKQYVEAFGIMKKREEQLQRRLATATAPKPDPVPSAPVETPPAPAPKKQDTPLQETADAEYRAIRAMQSNPVVASQLGTSRDISLINQDYVNFGVKLAGVLGMQRPIGPDGLFTPEANKLLADFFNQQSAEGDKIRSAAKAHNLEAPKSDELMVLRRASTLRTIQRSRFVRDPKGQSINISAEEAFAIAKQDYPYLFTAPTDPTAARREELERTQKALENRAGHSTEVPPALGAELQDVSKIPEEVFWKIVKKSQSTWTAEEGELVKKIAKANGLTDEELTFFIDQKQPKK